LALRGSPGRGRRKNGGGEEVHGDGTEETDLEAAREREREVGKMEGVAVVASVENVNLALSPRARAVQRLLDVHGKLQMAAP